MIAEVTVQLFEEGRPGAMWAYSHKEVVVPMPLARDQNPEDAITKAMGTAAELLLAELDRARESLIQQIANTAAIGGGRGD